MSNVKVGQFQNFVELLQARAKSQPKEIVFRFLPDGDITPLAPTLTFESLDKKAKAIAHKLLSICERGDRALLIYPSGLDFITAFFGCLYAGVIAVPAYPPKRNQKLQRLQTLIEDCDAAIALTDLQSYDIAVPQFSAVSALEHLPWLRTDEGLAEPSSDFCVIAPGKDEIAFLQYTSGSTGDPKGVMVSHENLIINSELIYTAMSHDDNTVEVGWLPLFHDMGLIGNVLQPVFAGIPCTFMQPAAFLQKPLRWLEAISEYKATTSGGPNFAYDICVSTIKDEELKRLDLSSWTIAFNGAEPIRVDSMRAFSEKFAPSGFRDEAHYPCYGMAETTLHITSNDVSRSDFSEFFDADLLRQNIVKKIDGSNNDAIEIVNCGRTWCDHRVLIVNPETLISCEEGKIGEIWAQGKTIAKGYWEKTEVTESTFNAYTANTNEGPFLRTGDLGFFCGGELYVSGRLKDILIIRGLNHYPQDVELTAFESNEALMPNGAAAFSVQKGGDELLIIILEVKRTFLRKFDANDVAMEVQKSISEQHDLQASSILFIKPGRLSKTSSGKVQRQRSKQLFLDDDIDVVARIDKRDRIDDSELPEFPVGLWRAASSNELDSQKEIIISEYLQGVFAVFAGIEGKKFPEDKVFLAYGLDSLSLSRIAAKVAEDLSVDIPIEAFFVCETIELLTAELLELVQTKNQVRQSIDVIFQEDNQYTLSYAQERMWFLSQFEKSTRYNISGLLDLSGDVDGSILAKSFQKIIARHESLRTRFVESDGQIVQRVAASVDWQLSILDLRDQGASALSSSIDNEMQFVFDLSKDVLFRATLYKKSDDEYTLAVSIHHIIADGWSVAVLLKELSSIYAALVEQREIPLEPLLVQYKDYSAWQKDTLSQGILEQQKTYWKGQLNGAVPLSLPLDKSRSSTLEYEGAQEKIQLSASLTDKIKTLSAEQGVTVYMTLLSAFTTLLHKYSGQNDICVGSPIAGRTRSETKDLIGFFVNTLVMRSDLSENPSFSDLLQQTKSTAVAAYTHQSIPFEQVVEAVQPERDLSISPLFQVMFVLQDAESNSLSIPNVRVSGLQQYSNTAKFDITLELRATENGLAGHFEYKTSLFNASTIQQLVKHFSALLESVVSAPESRLSELAILSDDDLKLQTETWNKTDCQFDSPVALHHMFELQAKKTPEAIAAVLDCSSDDESDGKVDCEADENSDNETNSSSETESSKVTALSISYQDLNARANKLANYLQRKGVERHSLVALCVDRSIDMLVGMLGILKAGGAYVPLDPNYPEDRLRYMLEHSQAKVLLTHEDLAVCLTGASAVESSEDERSRLNHQFETVSLDTDWNDIDGCSADAPELEAEAQDQDPAPAYVIYTSGSTGRPKGVVISHQAICNQMSWVQAQFPLNDSDVFLHKTPFSFDASVWEIWAPLLSDAQLLMAKPGGHQDLQYLADTIVSQGVTQLQLVPSLLQSLLEVPSLEKVSSLRRLFLGGEALSTDLARAAVNLAPSVVNLYGPTECTINATFFELSKSEGSQDEELSSNGSADSFFDSCSAYVPIGKPVSNLNCYVLDQYMSVVPVGAAGELYVSGAGLGLGYLHQSDLSDERFIEHTFPNGQHKRLYKTGDLVRYLADGNLDFLSRMDDQVKVRGFRIELGEIESVLLQHPAITEGVVAPKRDEHGNVRLVAYFVASILVDSDELRNTLSEKLPEYMQPAFFMALDALPRNNSGKIDRTQLPDPDYTENIAYVAAVTKTEKRLEKLWCNILGLEQIGRQGDFFRAGGHSLLATRLMLKIREAFSIEFPLRKIFEASRLADMAAAVDQIKSTEAERSDLVIVNIDPLISSAPVDERLPLSFSQQRLWIVDQFDGGSSQYNMPASISINGSIDENALEKSLNAIIDRHAVLRTIYEEENGQPFQVLKSEWEFTLDVDDLTNISAQEKQNIADEMAQKEALQPFNLSCDLMLRARLLKLSESESRLLVTLHHIASDGWSTAVLIGELNEIYNATCLGVEPQLTDLPCQYADYAHWQRSQFKEEYLLQQLKIWEGRLKGLPAVHNLPLDRSRPSEPSYNGASFVQSVDADITQSLDRIANENSATRFMILHAALACLISRYSGQNDIVIGTPIANREPKSVESLIGLFVNTLVLRSDLSETLSFNELLAQSKETCLTAFSASDIPFERLVDTLQTQRSSSYNPLFQIMLVMQNNESTALELHNTTHAKLDETLSKTKFDLTLNASEKNGRLVLSWEYATDLFDASTIEQMAGDFQVLLAGIVKYPDSLVKTLPLLSKEKKKSILVDWNASETDASTDSCIHELFEKIASEYPDNNALIFEDETLSYSALNSRANKLAHYLRSLTDQEGLSCDSLVGLCLDRSVDMIVAMLAILKAGYAYVPIDPTYPQSRISHILNDSGVSIVVTHSHLKSVLTEKLHTTVCLDDEDFQHELAGLSDNNIACKTIGLSANNLAYVIYTSGSTGKPKGSLLEHSGLCNLASAQQEAFNVTPDSRVIQFASFAFDAATWEVFMALSVGAALYIVPKSIVQSSGELSEYVAKRKITHATLPPALLPVLDVNKWSSVQDLVVAGEHCPLGLVKIWAQDRRFYNAYGPSEATVCATIGKVFASDELVHMGKPMAGVQIYILDDFLQPVPVTASGQLYVGGRGVGRGYLNRPELSAEKFIPNFFGSGRLYASGDLARWLKDGNLEFLGRIDHQVKIRGFRVELGEIETLMSQQHEIQECIVLALPDAAGTQQLVAYYVANNESYSTEDIKHVLSENLPDYMIPAFFIALEEFPVTPNGKVDRKALPAPTLATMDVEFVAPRNETETKLAEIWKTVLSIEEVGVHHNFFEIGGQSLLAIQVISRIKEIFSVQLKVSDLFVHTSIEKLSTKIIAADTQEIHHLPAIVPRSDKTRTVLSFEQQAYWFLYQLEEGSSTYNTPAALHLRGEVNVEALEKGLRDIISRHESLHTVFTMEDGAAVQRILGSDEWDFTLSIIALDSFKDRQALETQIEEDASYVFDLEKELPIRARLLKISAEESIFTLVMHHIIADGWSMDILVRELAQSYAMYAKNADKKVSKSTDEADTADTTESQTLPPLSIQYGDYAAWQNEVMQGEQYDAQIAYWQNKLQGLPPLLSLPTDYPRPPVQSYRGSEVRFVLPFELTQSLNTYAKEKGTTLFNALLAGLNILLSRYGRTQDIPVGTAIANRPQVELEALVGCFANTLVIRSHLDSEKSFHDFVQHVSAQAFEGYEHAGVPFDGVVEAVQPERSLGVPPIFQVMFRLHNHKSGEGLDFPGLKTEKYHIPARTAKLDLNFSMLETDGCLEGIIEYATDLFSEDSILRIAKHFQIILESAMHDIDAPIKTLTMLSPEEYAQVSLWNKTAVEIDPNECMHHLFEATAARLPNKIAYIFDEEKIDYQTLNARANQLANFLIARGIVPEDRVAMSVERSSWAGISVLATFKSGGTYVPLDANYPRERLEHMFDSVRPKIILTLSYLKDRFEHTGVDVVCLDQLDGELARLSKANLPSIGASHSAYILFTSGSTGKPKGIQVSHRSFRNMAASQDSLGLLDEDSRVLQFASLSFSISFWGTFMAWTAGGTLYAVTPDQSIPGEPLYQLLDEAQITHVTWPVSLLSTIPIERIPLSLQTIISSAEPCTDAVVERWTQRGCRFLNMYGNSEVSLGSTIYEYHKVGQKLTIGKALPNTQMYLLDEEIQQVPVGVIAEIHTAGIGLATCYVDKPAETAEVFIPCPFYKNDGSEGYSTRLYKTGDLGRYLPNGEIEFIGREDFQVSIRGFRVELTEVEDVLRELDGIEEVAVVSRDDSRSVARLVCFYVEAVAGVDVSSLREHVAKKLPSYMQPSLFVKLDNMPLTPNRKVDRIGLPSPKFEQDENEYIAAENPTEITLSEIWKDVLDIDKVSTHKNFFEIGGHSLLAVQVVSRAREQLNVSISIKDVFTYSTIRDLAEYLDAQEGEVAALPKITPRLESRSSDVLPSSLPTSVLPLSLEQTPYWFLHQLEGGSATYNVPLALRVTGNINPEALSKAFESLIQRHEILRTKLVSNAGKPAQWVMDKADFSLHTLRIHTSEIESAINTEASYVFDLENECAIRVSLLELSKADHVITVVIHHTIIDGWSLNILVSELAELYSAYCLDRAPLLADLPVQYADYALWQQAHILGDRYDQQIEYWKEKLAGLAPLLNLPTDYTRPPIQSYRGSEVRICLPFTLTSKLNQFAKQHSSTLFNVLLSGLSVVLSRYCRTEDIPIGTAVANRSQQEIEPLIGCFANTLVIRSRAEAESSFSDLVERVGATVIDAFEHADVPFDGVVDAVQPERNLGIPPIFQVMFRLHSQKTGMGANFEGLTKELISIETNNAKLDLNFSLGETEDGVEGIIEYASDLFSPETVARMGLHLETILDSAMATPQVPVEQLTMLSQAEFEQVQTWNETAVAYPEDEGMHHLFEKTVEHMPNKLAYVCGDDQFTYAELNVRANRLAHYLMSQGVGPEVRVGVSVERSTWAGISALATFKAGGTYVPLDANYPKDRLHHMIDVARPQLILTLSSLEDRYKDSGVKVICLDRDWDSLRSQPVTNPVSIGAKHSAYILFTSGTTGKPKGILVSHHSFRNMAESHREFDLLNADNHVLQFASLSFSIALWGTFMAWVPGGTLYSVTKDEALPGEALYQFLEKHQITHVTWPVSLLSTIPTDRIPDSLKTVISSAEPCNDAVVERWTKRGCRFINMYGNSEVSVGSTMFEYHGVGQKLTIGRALPNTQMYLLDEHLQQVSIGVIAEIHTAGVGLATCYVDNPVATASSFIPSPFSDDPSERLYKTGDLGRYLPNGEIEFIGREDFQVSIRGFRVELVEIEGILRELPDISEVVVVSRDDDKGLARLICFYVLNTEDADIAYATLRKTVGDKLPNYMVPSLFIRLAAMPLTPNRKIDRLGLPDTDDSVSDETDFVAPRNSTEEGLTKIWCSILEREKIGVQQNFFELGGHSLLATQVISQIRSKFDVEVTLQTLFKDPTIEALSLAVQQSESGANEFPIERITDDIDIPLSFAQERLWFLDRYEANSNFYHMPSILGLHGRLDKSALEQSFFEIVRRHQALRTNFMNKDGGAIQKVWPIDEIKWAFDFVDASANPTSALAEFDARIAAELQRNFDLEKDSLLRTLLFKVSDDEHKLFINMHHIVADGWSISVLIKEMRVLYEAFSHQQASPLEELAVQYPDFSVWQKSYLQGDVYQQQASYWSGTLEHLPIITLPLDFDRPENQTYSGDRIYFNLDPSLTEKIHTLSTQQGVTPFMTMLTVFNILLQRHSGQNDICIGTPIANRVKTEIEPLIGFFANTLTLRTDLSGDPSFLDVLSRVKRTTLGAYENQDLPFEKVVDLVLPKRDPSRSPLFQVSFALQKPPSLIDGLSGIRIESIETENKTAKFDLLLELLETEKGLEGYFEFNTDLFKRETIAAYAEQFSFLVNAVLQRPNVSIANFSLLALPEPQASATHEFSSCDLSTYPVLTMLLATECEVSNQVIQYAVLDGDHHAVASGTVGALYLIAEDMGDANESTQAEGVRGLVRLTSGETAFNTGFSARLTEQGFSLLAAIDRVGLVDDTLVYPEIVAQEFIRSTAIDDCYVMFKNLHNENSGKLQTKIIVYLSSQMELDEQALNSHLREAMPACPLPHAYTPVMSLPVLTHGDVNVNELSAIPVVSTGMVEGVEKKVSSLDGVSRVSVSPRYHTPVQKLSHLSDLIPEIKTLSKPALSVSTEKRRSLNESLTLEPAISYGGELTEINDNLTILQDVIVHAANTATNQTVKFYYADGVQSELSYSDILAKARRIKAGLMQSGLQRGQKVIFQFNRNEDFVNAFWGCTLAGLVPVPIAASRDYSKSNANTIKLAHAYRMMDKPVVLTSDDIVNGVKNIAQIEGISSLEVLSVSDFYTLPEDDQVVRVEPDDVALILLTSGSTGLPKCVQLSHKNVISRSQGSIQKNGFDQDLVSISWMPMDHVGGIVYFHIRDVYLGAKEVNVDIDYILADPLRWLELIHEHRVNITWAPNFAYSLIVDREKDLAKRSFDLSCMHFMLNGGEAVVPKTMQVFIELLAPHGLHEDAVKPIYGMSEISSGITYPERLELTYSGDDSVFVSVGKPVPGVNLRVVDEYDNLLKGGQSGRLQVSGLTMTQGYLGGDEINGGVFTEDGWFKTGDIAFIESGNLTITGREKDMIIINGINFYSHEIESVVDDVDGINISYTAACAVQRDGNPSDQLAVFFNTDIVENDELLSLIKNIRRTIVSRIGVHPSFVLPLDKEDIPKTEIGKIQLSKLSKRFGEGQFDNLVKRLDILEGNKDTLPNWFYQNKWIEKSLPVLALNPRQIDASQGDANKNQVLILSNHESNALAEILARHYHGKVIQFIAADAYEECDSNIYRIDPKAPQDYLRAMESLIAKGIAISSVIHLWEYGNVDGTEFGAAAGLTSTGIDTIYHHGLGSLYSLVKALKESSLDHPKLWLYVSSNAQKVMEDDRVSTEKTLVIPLLITLEKELSGVVAHHIDLAENKNVTHAEHILHELHTVHHDHEIAYRHGKRWVACLTESTMKLNAESRIQALVYGGAYLITGGLGGIAVELATYLIRQFNAKLLLVGRTAHEALDANKKEQLETLQGMGNVFYDDVDICDMEAIEKSLGLAEKEWQQKLNGIFHLAGLSLDKAIAEENDADVHAMLMPKVVGTNVLYHVVNKRSDTIFVNFSSVNGVFGGSMMGAYSAANRYQMSFVDATRQNKNVRTYTFAWSMWHDMGMGKKYSHMQSISKSMGFAAITVKQGMDSLLVCLSNGLNNVLIGLDGSKANIYTRLVNDKPALQEVLCFVQAPQALEISLGQLALDDQFGTAVEPHFICHESFPLNADNSIDEQAVLLPLAGVTHVQEEKVAPRNEIEEQLIKIATSVFDVTQPIGVKDNFFDVGANSLLIVKFHHEIQEKLQVEFALVELFNVTTVEKVANFLTSQQKPQEVASQARSVADDRKAAMQRRRKGRGNRKR